MAYVERCEVVAAVKIHVEVVNRAENVRLNFYVKVTRPYYNVF
jgi:hypothetical protein